MHEPGRHVPLRWRAGQIVEHAALLDLLARWVPDEAARRRVRVDDPAVPHGVAARPGSGSGPGSLT